MFTVGLAGKYNKPRHIMRSPATLLFFAIHIKELLSHFLPLLGKTFKMTLFTLEEIVSRYGRQLFPGLLKITLGRVTLQQGAVEPSLVTQEMVRFVCTLPSQGKELVSTVI